MSFIDSVIIALLLTGVFMGPALIIITIEAIQEALTGTRNK